MPNFWKAFRCGAGARWKRSGNWRSICVRRKRDSSPAPTLSSTAAGWRVEGLIRPHRLEYHHREIAGIEEAAPRNQFHAPAVLADHHRVDHRARVEDLPGSLGAVG